MLIPLKEGAAIYTFETANRKAIWYTQLLGQYFTSQPNGEGYWYVTNKFDPRVEKCKD